MKYLRKLPDESVEEWIRSRRQLLHDRKVNPAKIGGASVIIKCYDMGIVWSGRLPASPQAPDQGTKVLRITATADNMDVLYATSFSQFWVGSTANPRYTPGSYLADLQAGRPPYFQNGYEELPSSGVTNRRQWIYVVSGELNALIFLKLFIRSPDSVKLTVQEVN